MPKIVNGDGEGGEPITQYPYMNRYKWTQDLCAEQNVPYDKDFLWTTETKRLIRRLKLTGNNMVAVIGNQGSGKTATRENIQVELSDWGTNTRSLKWRSNAGIFEDIGDAEIMLEYQDSVALAAGDKMQKKSQVAKMNYDFDINRIRDSDNKMAKYSIFKRAIKELTTKEIGKLQYDAIVTTAVGGGLTFLIDFPDYDKHNRAQMLKDLTRFREWWDEIISQDAKFGEGININIVIFFQKELWGGHFAFGKFDVMELKPFKAAEMVNYYRDIFKGLEPFTEESLTYLAGLSRGIMRWFKKYIRVCFENLYDAQDADASIDTISIDNVKQWITVTQLAEDWDRELMEVMPKSRGMRVKAVEVMRYLYECGGATQADITENIFGGERTAASRLISKLELYGYLHREKQGRENMICFTSA
jgi:hypothetical protein